MLEDRSPQNESGSEPPQGYETREPSSMGMKAAIVIVVLIAAFIIKRQPFLGRGGDNFRCYNIFGELTS